MDSPKPPKPDELLDDLESIRRLLGQPDAEPPLLTEQLDPAQVPLLSEVVEPGPAPAASPGRAAQRQLPPNARELARLDDELRAAAQLLLQEVIDDFVPQIEAELRRRLSARLAELARR